MSKLDSDFWMCRSSLARKQWGAGPELQPVEDVPPGVVVEFFRNNKIVMMTGERDTHGCDNFHPLSQVNGVPQQDLSFYGACFITRTDASCISVHQCVCKDGLVCLTLHQALLM